MFLDLSQLTASDLKQLSLLDLLIFGAIAESSDKRLAPDEIVHALGKEARNAANIRTWYYNDTVRRCRRLWEVGLLRRFERRKLSRWRKYRKVGKLQESAYYALSEEGWILLSRLRCWDAEMMAGWQKIEPDLNEDYIGD